MGKLDGRVAIVTGAGSGIGRATARLFAMEGCKTAVIGRSADKVEQTVREIVAAGGEAIAISADLTNPSDVERMVQVTCDRYGGIDVLVNNAGILPAPVPLAEMEERAWDEVFDVNTKGVYRTVKAVWPTMVRRGGGSIVNTASVVAFRGVSGMAAYCATKSAVVMLTKVLALEGAPLGIRVNCVCPGFIDTPMNEWLGSLQPDREAWLTDMIDGIPLHRPGAPAEIARASLFLACSDSSYMTGQTLILDGGASI